MKFVLLAIVGIGLMSGAALAGGDAVKGEKVFKKCMACHAIAERRRPDLYRLKAGAKGKPNWPLPSSICFRA